MTRHLHLRWIVACLLWVGVAACGKQADSCVELASDHGWRALVEEMDLPDHRQQRLADYVVSLETSSCRLSRGADRAARARRLGVEIQRSLPLFVPASHRDRAYAYLRGALELP